MSSGVYARKCDMRKLAVLLTLLFGAACVALMMWKRQSAEPRPTIWEKMQERMDAMPDDFPPVVMFENVAATRENSEKILELLEKEGAAAEKVEPIVG